MLCMYLFIYLFKVSGCTSTITTVRILPPWDLPFPITLTKSVTPPHPHLPLFRYQTLKGMGSPLKTCLVVTPAVPIAAPLSAALI